MTGLLVFGRTGQVATELARLAPEARFLGRDAADLTDPEACARILRDSGCGGVINAAAYTAVDTAETPEGRKDAWATNALTLGNLARIANEFGITLVHVSSDYVFDGTQALHAEDEPFTPLGVYGQSKAAGDIAAATAPRHYIARTSWVIGEGNNFVKTMQSLANRGITPSVVSDQIGRLTFTDTLAQGIKHLIDTKAPYGTYNITNSGQPVSWADIAMRVFEQSGKPASDVTPVTTAEYYAGKTGIAPRPLQSTLDLSKLQATGFTPEDWEIKLQEYLGGDHA